MNAKKSVDMDGQSLKKKRGIVTVDLGLLKAPWEAYCQRNQLSPSKTFREIVRKLTGVGQSRKIYEVQEESIPVSSKKKRMTLRWTESELAAIQEMAEGHSSPNSWVIDSVRAMLTRKPQFGMTEIEVLWESNAQLMKIGTNLNQIARAINRNPLETDLARLELIEELRLEIRRHTVEVSALLNANLSRWNIE